MGAEINGTTYNLICPSPAKTVPAADTSTKVTARIAVLTVYEVQADSTALIATVAADLLRIRGGEAIGTVGFDVNLGAYSYKPVSRMLASDPGAP